MAKQSEAAKFQLQCIKEVIADNGFSAIGFANNLICILQEFCEAIPDDQLDEIIDRLDDESQRTVIMATKCWIKMNEEENRCYHQELLE